MRQRTVETASIQDHANAIREMVELSLTDPQTRKLAVSLASGSYEWETDPRTGHTVPVVRFHDRAYRVSVGPNPPGICAPRDYRCEIVQVWNFIVLNVRYTADADGFDDYQDLKTTLEQGGGDCDDATIAFCALLRSLGYRCYARIISLNGREWAHVYPLVEDPKGRVIPLDMTEDGKPFGWEYPNPAAIQDFHMGDAT